jgi:acyl carrier protein
MTKTNKEELSQETLSGKVKKIIAEYLGVDYEDIKDEDSLVEDLHMKPSDLSDLVEILKDEQIDTSNLDLTEIETIYDLVEKLESNLNV